MKLQLKTIVAAVALAVVAGHASAAIPLNNTATGTGVLFYAYDDSANTSYVQDLGLTFSSFLPSSAAASTPGTTNWSVGSNTSWSDYLASVSGDTSNTYWGVIAGSSTYAVGSSILGTHGVLSTIRVGEDISGQTSANAKSAVGTYLRNPILAINGLTPDATSGFFSASGSADNLAMNWKHNGGGKMFNVDNVIGQSSEFQYGNSMAAFSSTTYGNVAGVSTFSFDGGTLSYTVPAVPEPSSYAMMVGGLMLVGGIAARRRRNSAK